MKTKKLLAVVLSVIMLLSSAPLGGLVGLDLPDMFKTEASAATYNGLTYKINNGKVTITDCEESKSGALTIPSTIEGYPVTSIGDWAFEWCEKITSVEVPDGVTSIGEHAFENCGKLTSIKISNSVANIGEYAFLRCENLTNVFVGEANAFYSSDSYGVLYDKNKTTLIQYPSGSSNTSFTVPDSVTSIGYEAFCDCNSLTSVKIGNSVTSIGESAFAWCESLTSITIPSSVTSIDNYAFYYCTSLEDVYYSGTEEQWKAIKIGRNNTCLTGAAIHYNPISAEIQEYINEHVAFLSNPDYKTYFLNDNFAAEMAGIKGSAKYNWYKIISVDIDNYYDIVLSDLLLNINSEKRIEEIAEKFVGKEQVETISTIADTIVKIINQHNAKEINKIVLSKNEIYDFIFNWDGMDKSSKTYELLSKLFKEDSSAKNTLFNTLTGLDKVGKLVSLINTGIDVLTEIKYCTNYLSAMNAYYFYSDAFKSMFECTYNYAKDDKANAKLLDSMKRLIDSSKSPLNYAMEVYEASRTYMNNIAFKLFKDLFFKSTMSQIGNACAGIAIGSTTLGGIIGTKVAGTTIGTISSSVFIGVGLGTGISQLLTGASGMSKSMGAVVSVGELSKYVQLSVKKYGTELGSEKSIRKAELFDQACTFYKKCQMYSMTYTCNALQQEKDSLVYTFFASRAKKESYQDLINDLKKDCAELNVINCHKQDISKLGIVSCNPAVQYTGKAVCCNYTVDGAKGGRDYTVKCSNCVNPGAAKAVITCCGDYLKGTATISYNIFKVQYKSSVACKGSVTNPSVTVIYSNDKKLKKGTDYTISLANADKPGKAAFTIKFKGKYGGSISKSYNITLDQVKGLKASETKKTSVKLTWSKTAGAKYYKVERSTDGKKWTTLTTTSSTSYTAKKLTAGKKYQFRVTALDSTKKVAGKASSVLKTGTLTKAPTLTLKSTKSKTATASWKKVTGAEKYVVYKSTDGKKWTKVTTTTKTSYNLTKLTGGKKIYVKITAVNAYSKASAYSTAKNVTVKK